MKRALLAVCAVVAVSCGTPVQPRNTVQADAIAKSDLEGVWYFRQTVVGVPYATGFTFPGEQGENEMEKVVWDIQENVLIARRAYEFVRGTEKNEPAFAAGADRRYLGAPVAAFKITSHFDVIREYNASTGEEYDKLIESQERKWYERKFLRVDWSTNQITNFNFLADWSAPSFQPIKQDPVPYYVSDPNDPDAFRIERKGEEQAHYLEVTQKLIASPETVTFEDGTSWPLCFLEYTTSDCASSEIRVRNSFLRAPARDYEPRVYDDKEMERFGYFSTERRSYNRQYGQTETGRERFINRHNQWRHTLSDKRCQQDFHCGDASPGVRCVTELPTATVEADGKVTGFCSLPYAVRNRADAADPASADLGPRPIVYYLSLGFPEDLKPAAKELERQYDVIFRGVVEALQGRASVGPAFVLCPNNPVQAGDPEVCGQAGTTVRLGDLRFNLINWVDEPVSAGLLGYGPNSNDAESGEVISSTANVYGAQIDTYSAMARDIVRLVNGELRPDQFIEGVNVKEWITAQQYGSRTRTASQADVHAMADAMDLAWTKGLPKTPRMVKGSAKSMKQTYTARAQALAASQLLGGQAGTSWQRLAKLRGSDLERKLVTPDVLVAHGVDPRSPITKPVMDRVNPLTRFTSAQHRLRQEQRRRLGAHSVDLAAASFNDAILGFALGQKGADPQVIWKRIREQVFLSTALHEVGHTLGLRHNFAGSYDPMNYPKTFWDLRTNNGTKAPKPRYLDPESDAERAGVTLPNGLHAGITEFMQSSIMDYGANFNSDIQGLGKYDAAALKFGYGNLVEVFETVRDPYLVGAVQAVNAYGDALPFVISCDGNDYTSVHYTKLPELVDIERRQTIPFSQVQRKEIVSRCRYPDVVEVGPQDKLLVPYKFCSDEFESASTGCEMFDRGADVFEVAEAKINDYRSYYLFDAFRRDRLSFDPWSASDRSYRYFDSLRTMMQFYVLNRGVYADFIPDVPNDSNNFWRSPEKWGPYTVAVTRSFDFLGDVLMMPEPGPYDTETQPDGRELYKMDEAWDRPKFTLGLDQGRYLETSWEYDSGYFWYERIHHIGSFNDKVTAIALMTDSETWFLGKDVAADSRQYAINYWRLYPRQMLDLWGALMTDRFDRIGPVYDGTKLVTRPISGTVTIPPMGQTPVDPKVGFTLQLWMTVLGNALIPATYDQSFTNASRVWLQGNGQAITTTLPTVTFDDPYSGKTFVAVSYKVGILETGTAARMISHANELKGRLDPMNPATETALKQYIELLESQKTVTDTFGGGVF